MSEQSKQNDLANRSGKRTAVGSKWWEIRDNGEAIKFCDLITEARHSNGVVYLSLGSGIMDANNEGVCDIAVRLRMNFATAEALHSLLGEMIADVLKPTDKSQAKW